MAEEVEVVEGCVEGGVEAEGGEELVDGVVEVAVEGQPCSN